MAIAKSIELEKLQALRGMVDLLPENTALWQEVEACVRNHFKNAAVSEIRTPLLEVTELFDRGIGESTDVVGKEMYSFVDKGERACTLRPEGTASIVRAAIQHGLISQGPQKLWYGGPMFRYERPQAGRQRQFHQIGLEYIGFEDPRSDVDAIAIAWDLLKALGVKGLTLEINSLGEPEDRVNFREKLVDWLQNYLDQLDPESIDRLTKNPLRILDTKNLATQKLLSKAPLLAETMAPASKKRFEQVQSGLNNLDIPFSINPKLVRGLDYYTHTAFEITSTQLGAQATVCGGGRYDGLVKRLGGPSTPSIGWAIGVERLIMLISQNKTPPIINQKDIYIVNRGPTAEKIALVLSRKLRKKNYKVELDFSSASFSKQLKRANKSGSKWAIIIGENEAMTEKIVLKDLRRTKSETSTEEIISTKALFERFS